MRKDTVLRFLTLIWLLLLTEVCYTQPQWQKFPADKSMVARDLKTNKGVIEISFNTPGEIDNDTIFVSCYEDGHLIKTKPLPRRLSNSQQWHYAYFDTIEAGLHQYRYEVWNRKLNLIRKADQICCGDFYLINGQSNAVAKRHTENCSGDYNEFIRTFSSIEGIHSDTNWYLATGDGPIQAGGHIGQLGIALGASIVKGKKIPVCILNGAVGAKEIKYFQRDAEQNQRQENNYNTLYARVCRATDPGKVRAFVWYQGENDAYQGTPGSLYAELSRSLIDAWKTDYPNLEKIYIFQIKNGCGQSVSATAAIQQAQSDLALTDSLVEVIATSNLGQGADHCHYDYFAGYRLLGQKVSRLVNHFQYHQSSVENAFSARIMTLSKRTDRQLIAKIKNPDQIFLYKGIEMDFSLTESKQQPVSISKKGEYLLLDFSQPFVPGDKLSYCDIQSSAISDNSLRAVNGLLCTQNVAIKPYHPAIQESGSAIDQIDTTVVIDREPVIHENNVTAPRHLDLFQSNDNLFIYSESPEILRAVFALYNENGNLWRTGRLDVLQGKNTIKLCLAPGHLYLLVVTIETPTGPVLRKLKLSL